MKGICTEINLESMQTVESGEGVVRAILYFVS